MNRLIMVNLVLLLTACAGSSPVPEDRFYRIDEVQPSQVYPAPVINGGLDIDYTEADPLRSGRAVLYSERATPLQLNRYHYAFWVDKPPRIVQARLEQFLRASGVADRLGDGGQREPARYRLETRLLAFEQVRGGATPEVKLTLEASLEQLPAGPVLWTRRFSSSRPAGADDMHATAAAMHAALQDVLNSLQEALAKTPAD